MHDSSVHVNKKIYLKNCNNFFADVPKTVQLGQNLMLAFHYPIKLDKIDQMDKIKSCPILSSLVKANAKMLSMKNTIFSIALFTIRIISEQC